MAKIFMAVEQIMIYKKACRKFWWVAVCAIALAVDACGAFPGTPADASNPGMDEEEISVSDSAAGAKTAGDSLGLLEEEISVRDSAGGAETVRDSQGLIEEEISVSESAAGAKTENYSPERMPVQWANPIFENLVREKLAKPEGVIYKDEMYQISERELWKLFLASYYFSDDKNKFEWPVNGEISRLYGRGYASDADIEYPLVTETEAGTTDYHATSFHSGLDIECPIGTPVVAAATGTVVYAEYFWAYGNLIRIDHGNSIQTLYAHLQDFAVSVGDTAQRGQTIGTSGESGRAASPHLHFEVRIVGDHQDPQKFLR